MAPAIDQIICALVLLLFWVVVFGGRAGWKPALTIGGTSAWATDALLKAYGLLGDTGIPLGRTLNNSLIRLKDYLFILVIGGSGSGKGTGYVIPFLLSYFKGSVCVFDCKGELLRICGLFRSAMGWINIVLAPLSGVGNCWNVLDTIKFAADMFARARALADMLVEVEEREKHFRGRAVQYLTALIVYVCTFVKDDERNLNTVADIAASPPAVAHAAKRLSEATGEYSGLLRRMGADLHAMFDGGTTFNKEAGSVAAVAGRNLAFLNDPLVARCVARSDWDLQSLRKPGVTLWLQIPPQFLSAFKPLLRAWVGVLISEALAWDEKSSELFFILDECSSLQGLEPLRELTVRGRGSGLRAMTIFQTVEQARAMFLSEPELIEENAPTHLHLSFGSVKQADELSKAAGSFTAVVESFGNSANASHTNAEKPSNTSGSGSSSNFTQTERALIRPEEILRLPADRFLLFQRGLPAPVIGRKLRYFDDPLFVRGASLPPARRPVPPLSPFAWLGLATVVAAALMMFWPHGAAETRRPHPRSPVTTRGDPPRTRR